MVKKEIGMHSTLLAQAKALVERRHEGNTTKMFVCLDRDSGTRWDFSYKYKTCVIILQY